MPRKHPGSLTVEEISIGISTCLDNAQSLFLEGDVLMETGHYARALMCFLASEQEMGKSAILLAMAGTAVEVEDDSRWQFLWKMFRDHGVKAGGGFLGSQTSQLAGEEFGMAIFLGLYGYGPKAERQRQSTLYVDFDDDGRRWTSPLEITVGTATEVRKRLKEGILKASIDRDRGLTSAKALAIRREVWAEMSIPPPADRKTRSYAKVLGEFVPIVSKRLLDKLSREGFTRPLYYN